MQDQFLFHSWTPKVIFSLVAPPLVKILLLVFIRWNKNRSYTEKVKYPLFIARCVKWLNTYYSIENLMPYPEPTLKELSLCLGVVLYSSISFCWLGGAYFWPYLWRVYFLKRYNTVINLYSLAQNKAHPYKRHVQMIGCCTTGTSNIQVCISLADCILLIYVIVI